MRNQKPFDPNLNKQYDQRGKDILRDILIQGDYTNIIVREDEKDVDSFWDVSGFNSNNKIVYFDVEIKNFWKEYNKIPKQVILEGFDFPNRKSISHNEKQNKVNYLVIISADLKGAFFASKKLFEEKQINKKYVKNYGEDYFRRIKIEEGNLFIKKDNKWQRQ